MMTAQSFREWRSQRRVVFTGWALLTLLCSVLGTGVLYDTVLTVQSTNFLKYPVPESPLLASAFRVFDYVLCLGFLVGNDLAAYVKASARGPFSWTYYVGWAGGVALLFGARAAYRRARRQYASFGDLGAFTGATGLLGLLVVVGAWGFQVWVSSMAPTVRPADRALASRYNRTGFEALQRLGTQPDSASKKQPAKNTVLSPISLGTALHMIEEGARGQTAVELREALHLPEGLGRSVAPGPSPILKRLRHPEPRYVLQRFMGQASAVETRLENAGWFDSSPTESMKSAGLLDLDLEIRKEYRRVLEEHFDAEVYLRDFDGGELAQEINQWAAEKTGGKIRRVIGNGPKQGAVLANATYFFGEWSAPFDPENTARRPFVVPREGKKADTVRVPMMTRHAKYPYMQRKNGDSLVLQGVRLPYGETGRLAMYVFVPQDLGQFVRTLGPERWDRLTSAIDSTDSEIDFRMPKFTLQKRIDLIPVLQELGVEQAFTREADFARIVNVGARDSLAGRDAPFFLNTVKQKIYLKVNEKGTEAAAVSFGLFDIGAVPTMKVNRPFYFAIAERETGAILFHGAIRNPT